MNKEQLLQALEQVKLSPEFTNHEKALWFTHHDHWNKAHDLIQSEENTLAYLIHGYLHHLEGDHGNGDYWYRRSGHDLPSGINAQWEYILEVTSKS